jgi:hypothetical protein
VQGGEERGEELGEHDLLLGEHLFDAVPLLARKN